MLSSAKSFQVHSLLLIPSPNSFNLHRFICQPISFLHSTLFFFLTAYVLGRTHTALGVRNSAVNETDSSFPEVTFQQERQIINKTWLLFLKRFSDCTDENISQIPLIDSYHFLLYLKDPSICSSKGRAWVMSLLLDTGGHFSSARGQKDSLSIH